MSLRVEDTIVALSTPAGRSGLGVIRLSGPAALDIARLLVCDRSFSPEPRRVSLKSLRDPESGDILDQAVITYFESLHSFTGEDVIEISCHGSPPLLAQIIDVILSRGARAADPGEFTLRALSRRRLNLTQAEAVHDLINARTQAAVRQAARQLNGEFSKRLQPHKNLLIDVVALLESSVEFVEDDLPPDVIRKAVSKLEKLSGDLNQLAATFRSGRLLKEGIRVTLAGRPNVGKSSIFNSLLQSERAIVTEVPGTTRDTISELVTISEIPVLLTDTAGVRTTSDSVERLGVERTFRSVADSDLTIIVLDGSQPFAEEDRRMMDDMQGGHTILALNKSDLPGYNPATLADSTSLPIVEVSAKTGTGIERLRSSMMEPFVAKDSLDTDFVITNSRHYDLLSRSASWVSESAALLQDDVGEELVLVGLYAALNYLGEITGETTPDHILKNIFSTFCIGK